LQNSIGFFEVVRYYENPFYNSLMMAVGARGATTAIMKRSMKATNEA
jgi:hypothetical protein